MVRLRLRKGEGSRAGLLGLLVRVIGAPRPQPTGSSCLDALALLPFSRATPQSLLPFHSIPRFQFQWPLTVASVVFTNTQKFTTENVRLFKTVYPSIMHSQSKYKEKEEKTRYIKYMYIVQCTVKDFGAKVKCCSGSSASKLGIIPLSVKKTSPRVGSWQ